MHENESHFHLWVHQQIYEAQIKKVYMIGQKRRRIIIYVNRVWLDFAILDKAVINKERERERKKERKRVCEITWEFERKTGKTECEQYRQKERERSWTLAFAGGIHLEFKQQRDLLRKFSFILKSDKRSKGTTLLAMPCYTIKILRYLEVTFYWNKIVLR